MNYVYLDCDLYINAVPSMLHLFNPYLADDDSEIKCLLDFLKEILLIVT
jgi:hypothetical protein